MGGAQDGLPNYAVTSIPVKALAKEIRKKDTLQTADVSALGDVRTIIQGLRGSTEFQIDLEVDDAGADFDGFLGNYVRVEYKELSTMAAFKVFIGIITGYELVMPDGATMERLTIACDANGA